MVPLIVYWFLTKICDEELDSTEEPKTPKTLDFHAFTNPFCQGTLGHYPFFNNEGGTVDIFNL